jgi:serine-type D-Ala-D-Ala carboxypeptidase (penicillin-binding protein 5/6)
MFRTLIALLLIIGLGPVAPAETRSGKPFNPTALLEVEAIPKDSRASIPHVEAKSALLVDADTGIALFSKNPDLRMPMASLTKIMTAAIILEHHRLDEVVTVGSDFNQYKELGVRIWLHQYEKITVGDLLIGLLVPSAGDAAMALAEYHSGTVKLFVDEMNQKAKMLGLVGTQFKNPIGLDEEGHYSTAFDLATLTRYALRFPEFRRIIQMSEATVASTNGKISHSFKSTDELLGSYLNIEGVKTGTTDEAGQSVINLAKNSRGHEVLSVVLDSPDRFQESKSLLDWSFRNFDW